MIKCPPQFKIFAKRVWIDKIIREKKQWFVIIDMKNMHMVCTLLWFVTGRSYLSPLGLLYWLWDVHMISPVPVNHLSRINRSWTELNWTWTFAKVSLGCYKIPTWRIIQVETQCCVKMNSKHCNTIKITKRHISKHFWQRYIMNTGDKAQP